MWVYLYTFRIDKRFSDWGRVFGIEFFQIPVLSPILELGDRQDGRGNKHSYERLL